MKRVNKLTDKQRNILYYLVVVIIIVGLITGLSFAWFSATVSGNDEAKSDVVETANLSIVYENAQELKGINIMPGWSEEKTFTIINNSDATAYYELVWANLTNTFVNKSDLVYSLTSTNGGRTLRETMVPESGTNLSILKYISIEPGVTEEYTLTIHYKNLNKDQNSDQGKKLLGKIEVKEGTTLQRLPKEYQEVEFIESTGSQYIDTGYHFETEESKIITDLMVTSNPSSQTLFGSEEYYNSSRARYFSDILHGQNGGFSAYVGTGSIGNVSIGMNLKRNIELTTNNDKLLTIKIDGELKLSNTYSGTILTYANAYNGASNKGNIFIFSNHADASVGASQIIGGMKLYSFMMYDNDILVRNFIPCYRKSDSKPGMYDLSNNVFYTNAGSGEFLIP